MRVLGLATHRVLQGVENRLGLFIRHQQAHGLAAVLALEAEAKVARLVLLGDAGNGCGIAGIGDDFNDFHGY